MWMTGLKATAWETGSWADIAGMLGGPVLRVTLIVGGMFSAFAMFNALVMSYSRLPLAMARDGMLPKFFGWTSARTQAPWVAILFCATCWALCLGLGFRRLVTLDIMLYGISLMLEAGHEIVSVANDNHVPVRHFLAPFLGPQIENVMQIHVGQQR